MQIAVLGLGKMGSRIAEKLVRDGHQIVVWNRSENAVVNFKLQVKDLVLPGTVDAGFTIKEVIEKLKEQKIIWMMLPAGEATEQTLLELKKLVNPGDIIIDGGNSYYKDTQRRFEELKTINVRYLGIGVSGGIKAFENGYPLMVGGDKNAFEKIKPILDSLIKPSGGYQYFGEGGVGHFIKMVHNGIEYGMMQAIGEGFGVLEKAPYNIDLVDVAKLWQKNTIITSFLMDCAKDALEADSRLEKIDGVIDALGEGEWTVKQGQEQNVPIENIKQSLDFRTKSKQDTKISSSFAAKMVAALRREFGGHNVTVKKNK